MTFPPPESLLPHRPPNLYVSEILAAGDGHVEVVARIDAASFAGHFPGRPVLPGVVMVEILAQALACLARIGGETGLGMLTGVEKARFRGVVELPAELVATVDVVDRRFGLTVARGTLRHGDRTVCTARLQAVLAPP